MPDLKIVTITVLFMAVVFFLFILSKYGSEYKDYVNALNRKEYPLRSFLPLGLYVLDRLKYSYNSSYDRKILNNICEIYGQEYLMFYSRVFYAQKVVILYGGILLQPVVGVISGNQVVFHFYLLLVTILFILMDDIKLRNKVVKRRLEIQLEFPDFVNKLTLLLNAGLTISKAWEKIAVESKKEDCFYQEVSKTITEMKAGKNELAAYSDFAKRAKSPEISRMMSMIIQNTKKGGTDLVLSLRLQSDECWEMRKNVVRRLGEEASTKLLFPMMIMFFAIIIIVVTPAIISMQGITSNF